MSHGLFNKVYGSFAFYCLKIHGKNIFNLESGGESLIR